MTPIKPLRLSKPFEALRRRQRENDVDDEVYYEEFIEDEVTRRPRAAIPLLNPIGAREARRKRTMFWISNAVVLLTPIVLTAAYLAFVAKPGFEVEAVFMVKMPPSFSTGPGGASGGGGGLGALLGGKGAGSSVMPRAIDESFAVIQYVNSREAFQELENRLERRRGSRVLSGESRTTSPISSSGVTGFFGSWFELPASSDFEARYAYYLNHVSAIYDEITGQIDLKADAYDADTATQMAEELVKMSEELVNQFNLRSERDFLERTRKEVEKTKADYDAAAAAVTKFRLDNNMIDPKLDGSALGGIITGLLTSATSVQAEISNMIGRGITSDAQLRPLRIRLAALQDQIESQKAQLTGQGTSLAPIMAQYAVLDMNQQIAQQQYVSALGSMSNAIFQASAQKLYVVNIISPKAPSEAQFPDKQRIMMLAMLFSLIGLIVFRTIVAAVRDHMV